MRYWILFFIPFLSLGQKDSLQLEFGGFLDNYYSYDIDAPKGEQKLPFMYNYNRHNEFAVNLALLKAKITYKNCYASIALQAGTYVMDNYANENVKYLNEAYVGSYLDQAKKHNIEIGILPSYIGFESAASLNNPTLTRSILADNSPYFMTGIWYHYNPNSRWSIGMLVMNGWQRIQKPERSAAPALGTQLSYKPSSKHLLNWSSYAGKEQYAAFTGMRWFENFYWDAQWSPNWRTILGVDWGIQNTPDGSKNWWSPIAIAQYQANPQWQIALRLEYYSDTHQMIIAAGQPFATLGSSVNVDYTLNKYCKYRIETRYLSATEAVLNSANSNLFFTTGLVLGF
jgi:hypothetical protein